ncbi:HEPN domain-containing protein [Anaerolineales bacterium HSG25]|nr:HEPN domain-containing protein [Anaerolineales bacterium HSG25]
MDLPIRVMGSQALIEFRNALKLAESLADIDRDNYNSNPRIAEQQAVQALRGGATVLMVAAFEQFLRDMLVEHLDTLSSHKPPIELKHLPQDMRVNLVYSNLDWAMRGKPYEPTKQKADRLEDIDKVCRNILAEQFNNEVFGDVGGNPNAARIKNMYKKIGTTNIFAFMRYDFDKKWKKPETQRFLEDKINEIVERRHIVAHTANALNIGRADLRGWLRFLRVFSKTLDNVTGRIITKIIKDAYPS